MENAYIQLCLPTVTTQMRYNDLPRDNGQLYIVKFPDGEFSDPQG